MPHLSSVPALAVLGVLATAALVPPAGAAGKDAVPTTITVKSWSYDSSAGNYRVRGTVTSTRAACERDRLVRLRHGDFLRSDRTDADGRWAVRVPADAPQGDYTAIAVRKVVHRAGPDLVCARDTDRFHFAEG